MRGLWRYVLVCALALCVCTVAGAQRTGVSASLGGASVKMDDMKYLLDLILETYPVEGAVISSFPPYLSGSVSAVRQFYPYLRAGFAYSYTSTGARANYTDYSGNIQTDISMISHRLGAFVNYSLIGAERLDLSLFGRLDANYSTMDITSSIYVLSLSNIQKNQYSSISPNGTVGLEFLYKLKDAAIGIEGGYLVDLPGKLKDRETGNELLDPNDRQRVLTSDWSGWRVGIKGIIWLK
jgi:hypothetical protein